MLHLGCADADRQGSQRTIGGGVGNRHRQTVIPGKQAPCFGTDDMHYSLPLVKQFKIRYAPFPDVSVQGIQLFL